MWKRPKSRRTRHGSAIQPYGQRTPLPDLYRPSRLSNLQDEDRWVEVPLHAFQASRRRGRPARAHGLSGMTDEAVLEVYTLARKLCRRPALVLVPILPL